MSNIKVFPINYDSQIQLQSGGSYEYPNFTPKVDILQKPKIPEITIKQPRNQLPLFFNKPRKPLRVDIDLSCNNLEEENKILKEQIESLNIRNSQSQKLIDDLTTQLKNKPMTEVNEIIKQLDQVQDELKNKTF
jgi:hypothetical protein